MGYDLPQRVERLGHEVGSLNLHLIRSGAQVNSSMALLPAAFSSQYSGTFKKGSSYLNRTSYQ
jgi:hypothetical protein